LQQQQGFSIGRSTEISRDEVKFNKFIVRLRKKFAQLFNSALRVQLIAKGIIRPEEWDEMKPSIKYDYLEDNHYSELKDAEILLQRIQMLQQVDPYIGKYYSMEWARKNILRLQEEDIQEMQKQIDAEQDEYLAKAEHDGTMAGATQAAQQNFLQQNAPQAQEMSPDDQGAAPVDAQQEEQQETQSSQPQTKQKSGWPN
jgi:hypothetical protein